MDFCFRRRVEKITLGRGDALLPLFEAIVNSMQEIRNRQDACGLFDGYIQVRIYRDKAQTVLDLENPPESWVHGFSVTDNGTGFTSVNMESFRTSDSELKKDFGGQGVGRLLWLKAFENVSITSTFEETGKRYKRKFRFSLDDDGVSPDYVNLVPTDEAIETTIRLDAYKSPFKERCTRGVNLIADRIAEHCFLYFMNDRCPNVTIHEGDNDKNGVSVNAKVDILTKETAHFTVAGHQFTMVNLNLAKGSTVEQKIHYCADNRTVETKSINSLIPDAAGHLKTKEGNRFIYKAFVTGPLLDKTVNEMRDSFRIATGAELDLYDDEPTLKDIFEGSVREAARYLSPYTKVIAEAKIEDISKYIKEKAYWFKHLLKNQEALNKIPPGLTETDLDIQLYRVDQEVGRQNRERLHAIEIRSDTEDVTEDIDRLMKDIGEREQSKLAEYVVQRRVILDLFEKRLGVNADGQYPPEKAIHSIVYPMRATSDDCMPDTQNLWIIDERLSYHSYLASDKLLSSIKHAKSKSAMRPDIAVFNRPIIFSDGTQPTQSVVIIEFKQAGRNKYSDKENPVKQVLAEVTKLRTPNRNSFGEDGRLITIGDGTLFYCYVYATLTTQLRDTIVTSPGFHPMPDNMGYFAYHDPLNTWIEVVDYEKLLSDAKKRNAILFHKLGLRR